MADRAYMAAMPMQDEELEAHVRDPHAGMGRGHYRPDGRRRSVAFARLYGSTKRAFICASASGFSRSPQRRGADVRG